MFIYRTQEGYRHVHVHPKPYRAYKIIRIEIHFVFLALEKHRIDDESAVFSAGKIAAGKTRFDGYSNEYAISPVSLSLSLFHSQISLFLSVSLSHPLASLTITCYTDVIQLSIARVLFHEKHHDQFNEFDYRRACIKIIPYFPRIVDRPSLDSLVSCEFTLIDRNEFLGYSFVRYRPPGVLIPSSAARDPEIANANWDATNVLSEKVHLLAFVVKMDVRLVMLRRMHVRRDLPRIWFSDGK